MIKNAFAYVTRKSLKSIIILLVIMAMSTLSLISLAIKDATNRASEETFGNITNNIIIDFKLFLVTYAKAFFIINIPP